MNKALIAGVRLFCLGILLSVSTHSFAQSVQFKVELLNDGLTYRVSMKPSVSWSPPQNTVLGAQATLLAPTGNFQVTNLVSLHGFWANAPKITAPTENPAFDYFVFYMQGSTAMPISAGVETPLFTFQRSGNCTGAVELIHNGLDEFMPPNSQSLNVGNDFTTTGGGGSGNNLWAANYAGGSAICAATDCFVKYRLTKTGSTWTVSMIPMVTWHLPNNTTSTQQVTIKVPTGGFVVSNLTSLTPGANYANASRFNQPTEAPAIDYLVFNLQNQGTMALPFQQGIEVPLFSFQNSGNCGAGGNISLMPVSGDPFAVPNTWPANVGQQLTTLGYGSNDVPICLDNLNSTVCGAVAPPTCLIDYKLTSLGGGKYQFSIIPHITWNNPANTTATMQASIKVPTGGFAVANLTNLTGAQFALSSRYDHPAEAPGFDYLDFNLQNQGTTAISYQNGVEVALFTFENTGPCSGSSISLVPNNDPFFPPNGSSANVGQQLSTAGGGADVPICISGSGSVACETVCRVDYELLALGGGKYQVSMIPRITWNAPANTTSTMQVSLRAPTGGLEIANLTNLVAGAAFAQTSRYDHPTESAGFDYLDFTLQNQGTTSISYQNGVKVPLFTFENVGECTGGNLSLVQNNDPFFPPNSQSANVGQQLTTAGFGSNDVPICIVGSGSVACEAACLVEYKLTDIGNGSYLVSMIPHLTWNAPDNITATMQVTIKVPTGGFLVDNLTSLVPGAAFSETSRYDHPSPAAPTFDYISFTLQNLGTSALSYQNGVEVGLFTFQNGGSCTGNTIYLIDENDPFLPPNAQNANVGQQLTTYGYGSNDVPICINGSGSAPCSVPLPNCIVNLKIEPVSGCKYQVSMIPQITWNSPDDVTKVAKLTLRVPHGCFSLTNLTSLNFGGSFSIAQTVLAPPDNPDFDYYCLNMTTIPTVALGYQAGVAVPLLTFENGGSCCGLDSVRIMNMADPMADGNSLNLNLDPHWETAGTGPSGTTPCLVGTGAVPCMAAGAANLLPASVDICPGIGVQLSPTAGFATYLWSPGTGLSCTACQNPTATPSSTTTYTLTASTANGCATIDQITVNVKTVPTISSVSASNPTTCGVNNGSIVITATGTNLEYSINNGYAWQASNAFPGLAPGTYEVVIRSTALGCPVNYPSNPVTLTSPNAPTILSVTASNPTNCGTANGSIVINASGSNLLYSINGGTTYFANNTFSSLAANTYNIRVKNSVSNCVSTAAPEVLTSPTAPNVPTATSTATTDCSISDGTISISASGGTAPLSYSIDNGATWQTSNVFTGLAAGSYPIRVRNANGSCETAGASATVAAPAMPNITAVTPAQPTTCNAANGSLTINASGGVGQLEYSIDGSNWQTANLFSGLAAGSYTVFVRNQDNTCPKAWPGNPVIIAPANSPTIGSLTPQNVTLCTTNNGSITVNATGGTPPLEYSLNPAPGGNWQSSNLFQNLAAGIYTAFVRNGADDSCEKQFSGTVTLTAPAPPVLNSATGQNPTSCTVNNGTITVSASGQNLQYSINNGGTWQAGSSFSGLGDGIYTVLVRNSVSLCLSGSQQVTLTAPAGPSILQVTASPTTDCGTANGQIVIDATGGIPPFQYSINNGVNWQTSNIFQNLAAGSYPISVRNSNGSCVVSAAQPTVVNTPPQPNLSAVVGTAPTGCATNDGSISITATGGIAPLEYSINGNDWLTDPNFTGLAAGSYTIWVRNQDNTCPKAWPANPVILNAPAQPTVVSATPTNPGCANNDGSITISANGGVAPLQYSINNISWQASPNFTGLPAGSYTVRVRNANGSCANAFANAVVLSTPALPVVNSITPANPTTCSTPNGSISISASGQNLQYSINGGTTWQNSSVFNALMAGVYTIVVRNSVTLCQSSPSQMVNLTAPASATFTSVNASPTTDCGLSNGSITVAATGGQGPLEFSINNINWQTGGTFSGLAAGSYTVQVRNFNSTCPVQYAQPVVVGSPAAPVINSFTQVNPGCISNDGSITISANGGTAPIQYSIDNVSWQASPVFSNLAAGSYTIRVRNANGSCPSAFANPVVLTSPALPTVNAVSPTNPTTCSLANGTITVSASGQNLQYSINGGSTWQNSPNFTGLAAGNYSVVVRNSVSLCQSNPAQTVTLTAPAAATFMSVNATPTTDCNLNNGTITVAATGGAGPLEFSLNNINWQTSGTFSGLAAGSYPVFVRNFNGTCTVQNPQPVVVGSPAQPSILTATATQPGCSNNDGSILISATGGTAPLEYSINNINWQTSPNFTGLAGGSYTVRVRNANGSCANPFASPVVLTAPAGSPVVILITPINSTNCSVSDGSITISASGQNLQFSINGGATFQNSNVFTGLAAGNYSILVRNSVTLCQSSPAQPVTLTAPAMANFTSANATAPTDCGLNNGSISVAATGGLSPLEFSINNTTWQTGTTFSGLAAGSYTVWVRNFNGTCAVQFASPVVVAAPASPSILSATATQPGCANNNGSIIISANGGIAPLEYSIDNVNWQTSPVFSNLPSGSYTIRVRNANGSCANAFANAVVLTAPTAPVLVSATPTMPSGCIDAANGSITILATGQNLQYSINGGATWSASNIFNTLPGDVYTVVVRNSVSGCLSASQPVTLLTPASPSISSATVTPSGNCNLATGTITVVGTGGTPPLEFSIDHINWQTGTIFSNVAPGTHTIYARNSNGSCETAYPTPVVISGNGQPVIISVSAQNPGCTNNDGTISITASGGAAPYEFSLNGTTWQSSNVFSGLAAGSYSIFVRNQGAACSNNYGGQVVLTGAAAPAILSVVAIQPAGCGISNGQITISASGQNLQYSINGGYAWQSSNTFAGLTSGTYIITVRNGLVLCQSNAQIVVLNAPTAPAINAVQVTATSNCGLSDGSIFATATGGTAPYQFSRDGGANWQANGLFTGLAAGTYSIMVRNSNGTCPTVYAQPITVQGATQPVLTSVLAQQPTCAGNDGVISATATGGISPYQFSINGTTWQTSNVFSGLSAGTFTVYVRNNNGTCSNPYFTPITLTGGQTPVISAVSPTNPTGCGATNGSISITASGQNLQYSINGGASWQSSNLFSNLAAGTYSVVVRNLVGLCVSPIQTATLTAPTAPIINGAAASPTADCGVPSGSITVSATGGIAPLEYSLNGTTWQASNFFAGLAAGNHTVFVRNSNQTCPVQLNQPVQITTGNQPIVVSVFGQQPGCAGNDGQLTVYASGGAAPYQYSINGTTWQFSNQFTGLAPGSYTVYVRNNGSPCSNTFPNLLTLVMPDAPMVVAITPQNPTGCGVNNGSITISASGANLQFSINGGISWQSSNTFTGLAAGTYSVLARSSVSFCQTAAQIRTLVAPTGATILSVSTTNPATCATSTGSIQVNATGGQAPLSYSINGGVNWQTNPLFANLPAGTYSILVRNTDGSCVVPMVAPVVLTSPAPVSVISILAFNPDCSGNNGSIFVQGAGGAVPLEFSINNGSTWQSAVNGGGFFGGLPGGNYAILVRNNNGSCQTASPVNLTLSASGAPMILSVTPTNPTGCGLSNGQISVNATGVNIQYSLDGINWQASSVFLNLPGGTYSVRTRNSVTGCQSTPASTTLTAPTAPTITNVVAQSPADCSQNFGLITVTANGGQAPLEYSINGVNWQTNPVFAAVPAGSYTVQVRNFNGTCAQSWPSPVVISTQTAILITNINTVQPTCAAPNSGSIFITASGNGPLEYSLDGLLWQANNSFNNLPAGGYLVRVRYQTGGLCVTTAANPTVLLAPAQPSILSATPTAVTDCGLNNGSITVVPTGGNAPLQYSIDGGANWQTSPLFGNLPAGSYTIQVANSNLTCPVSSAITVVSGPTAATILNVVATNPTSCATTNGTISITANGGQQPLEYSINGGASWTTNGNFTGLAPGNYSVQVRNSNGFCVVSWPNQVTISGAGNITINQVLSQNPNDCNQSSGDITILATGSPAPLRYSNDNGATWQAGYYFSNLSAGVYPILVSDANGNCPTAAPAVVLTNKPSPSILTATPTAATACGTATGAISIAATGGILPLSFSIDNGLSWQASGVFTNLAAGFYVVKVRNADGSCIQTMSALLEISEPAAPVVGSVAPVNPTACGLSNGSITINATGAGTLQYSLNGLNWQSSPVFPNLAAGSYFVHVRSANNLNCTSPYPLNPVILLADPNGPKVIAYDIIQVTDCGLTDGKIDLTVSGGTPPLQISIDGGANFGTSTTFSGLAPGSYSVVVRNADGTCPAVLPLFTLVAPTFPIINGSTATATTDCSAANGQILVIASGGTGAREFSLNGIDWQSSGLFKGLLPGSYTPLVRNFTGGNCLVTGSPITVGAPANPTITAVPVVPPTACGATDGSLTIQATGGTGPLQYSIDGIYWQASNSFLNLSAGTYTVFVRNNNGTCATPWTGGAVMLTPGPQSPVINSVTKTNVTDCGLTNGTITVNASGGTAPLRYSKDGGTIWQTSNQFLNLPAGHYDIVVSNADGSCPSIYPPVQITAPTSPQIIQVNLKKPVDCKIHNAAITILAVGSGPLQYSIDGGTTWHSNHVFSNLGPGAYNVFVRNADGTCPVEAVDNPYISCEFDLALRKVLAPGQPSSVHIGDDVKFRITVYNQGFTTAKNIQVTDYLPVGTVLSATGNAAWTTTTVGGLTQIWTVIPGPLVLGDSAFVDISVRVIYGQDGATLINRAEISSATDLDGNVKTDVDSHPDATNGNDNEIDNVITDKGPNDEDDEDPAPFTLLPTDPIGYIYCDKTGKIVPGGKIKLVSAPAGGSIFFGINMAGDTLDGRNGKYQFYTNGQPGVYNFTWMHPNGYPLSTSCTPQPGAITPGLLDGTPIDKDGLLDGTLSLGSTVAAGDSLANHSCGYNPYWLSVNVVPGDQTVISENNIPIQCVFIGSFVCEDTNGDGLPTPGEPRLDGATVELFNCSNMATPIATTTTANGGKYRFDGLVAGDYKMRFIPPGNYRLALTAGGQPVNVDLNGFSACVSLSFGECDTSKIVCMTACPQVTVSANASICLGQSVQLLASYPAGTISWVPANGSLSCTNCANPTASPTATTSYIATVQDGFTCISKDTVVITVTIPPTANFTVNPTNPAGCNTSNGSITVNSAQNGLEFSINNGGSWQSSNVFSGLAAGSYQVQIRFVGTSCATVFVNNPVVLSVAGSPTITNVVAVQPTNCTSPNGSITISASGTNLEFSINGGATWQPSNVFSALGAGNYEVRVRSTTNPTCVVSWPTVSMILAQPQIVNVLVSSNCNAGQNSITVQATGGQAPLEYSIDGGQNWQTNAAFSGLAPGFYSVQVRNGNGSCAVAWGQPVGICVFDLALKKTLSAGQSSLILLGDTIDFDITIYNQGVISAKNIAVVDYLPAGMAVLAGQSWTMVGASQMATMTFAGPLAPGQSAVISLKVRLVFGGPGTMLKNVAEIKDAEDLTGNHPTDFDSQPDMVANNDNEIDNVTDNGGGDEDDADFANVMLDQFDPEGYIYCHKTGKLITGGNLFLVSGPVGGQIFFATDANGELLDGRTGMYQLFTNGVSGVYELGYTHPNGYPLSTMCAPQNGIFNPAGNDGNALYDKDGLQNGIIHLGQGGVTNGILTNHDCAANPYFLKFYLNPNETTLISNNNLPISCGMVGGRICLDQNGDGLPQPNEAGVGNISISLFDCSNPQNPTLVKSVLTNGNGNYSFDGLAAGNYQIKIFAPTGYTIGGPGFDVTGLSPCFPVLFTTCDSTRSACFSICPTISSVTTVNPSCPTNNGVIIISAQCAASMMFSIDGGLTWQASNIFTNLAPGTYHIKVSNGSCFVDWTVVITLGCQGGGATTGSLAGHAWKDCTGPTDGLEETGEHRLPGIAVTLTGSQNFSTTTDASGNYSFAGVPTGSYSIQFGEPTGLDFTGQNVGSDDTKDSDVNGVGQGTVVILAGQTVSNFNAGYLDVQAPAVVFNHPSLIGKTDGDTIYMECSSLQIFDVHDATGTDNCDTDVQIDFVEQPIQSFPNCSNGFLVIMHCGWIATDDCGNSSQINLVMAVRDTTPPTMLGLPADITLAAGQPIPPAPPVKAFDFCDALPTLIFSETTASSACGSVVTRKWTATDDCGNSTVFEQKITVGGGVLAVNVAVNSPASCGLANGSATLSPVNLSYSWSDGGTGFTRNGLAAGVYSVTATSGPGCTTTISLTILTNGAAVSIQMGNVSPATCAGLDGSATFISQAGVTFAWSDGGTGASRSNLAPGNYGVTASNSAGCTATTTVLIGFDNSAQVSATTISPATCAGNDGGATLTPAYFNFAWSDGGTGFSRNNLAAGSYSITATSAGGCADTISVQIVQMNNLAIALVSKTDATCAGNNGAASFSPTSLNFAWSDGGTGAARTNLAPGIYGVTASNSTGCTATTSVTILLDCPGCVTPILENVTTTAATCGDPTGTAWIYVVGNESAFSFTWFPNTGTTTGVGNGKSGLLPGTYLVAVRPIGDTCELKIPVTILNDTTGCVAPPSGPNFTGIDDGLTFYNCKKGEFAPCMDIPFDDFEKAYRVRLNGVETPGLARECDVHHFTFYHLDLLTSTTAMGPFKMEKWMVGGQIFTGDFTDFQGLVALMNLKNPAGNWQFDAVQMTVRGEAPYAIYGNLEIREVPTNSLLILEKFAETQKRGTTIDLPDGSFSLIVEHKPSGLADTVTTVLHCLSTDTIRVIMEPQTELLVALDLSELLGQVSQLKVAKTNIDGDVGEVMNNPQMPEGIVILARKNGLEHTLLLLIDNAGVQDTTWLEVRVLPKDVPIDTLIVFNAFSPNNDGKNDHFIVQYLENYPGSGLKIFNRWGERVFESDDYQNDWDGRSNERDLPNGIYFFVLEVSDGRERISGWIDLWR